MRFTLTNVILNKIPQRASILTISIKRNLVFVTAFRAQQIKVLIAGKARYVVCASCALRLADLTSCFVLIETDWARLNAFFVENEVVLTRGAEICWVVVAIITVEGAFSALKICEVGSEFGWAGLDFAGEICVYKGWGAFYALIILAADAVLVAVCWFKRNYLP